MANKRKTSRRAAQATLVGLSVLFLVLLSQGGGLLGQWLFAGGAVAAWVSELYGLAYVVVVFLPPFLFLRAAAEPFGYQVRLQKGPVPVEILLPLFLGLMVVVNSLSNMLLSLGCALIGVPLPVAEPLPEGFLARLIYFLYACVGAAVLEELFFRGAVQPLLRAWGPRFSIVVTSLLFTLMHASLWDLPSIFVLSLLLGYVAEISQSVMPSMVLHAANNLAALLMLRARERLPTQAAFALVVWAIVLLIGLFAAAVWQVRQRRLGPRFKLRHDAAAPGSVAARTARLLRVPAFSLGCAAVVAQFILGIVAL